MIKMLYVSRMINCLFFMFKISLNVLALSGDYKRGLNQSNQMIMKHDPKIYRMICSFLRFF